jgi:hypothetical protein
VQEKTPVVRSTGTLFGLNIISAVNALGEFRFMVMRDSVATAWFVDFI